MKKIIRESLLSEAKLNLPKEYFDLVTMFDVIEHLPKNKEKDVLIGIRRVLRDGGKLIISTPNANILSNLLGMVQRLASSRYSNNRWVALIWDKAVLTEIILPVNRFFGRFL